MNPQEQTLPLRRVTRADIEAARSSRQPIDLTNADLRGEDLRGLRLNGYQVFSGSDLSGCNLSKADLRFAAFEGADLTDANCTGADLRLTYLRRANLTRTNFQDANLASVQMEGAELDATADANLWLLWALDNEDAEKAAVILKNPPHVDPNAHGHAVLRKVCVRQCWDAAFALLGDSRFHTSDAHLAFLKAASQGTVAAVPTDLSEDPEWLMLLVNFAVHLAVIGGHARTVQALLPHMTIASYELESLINLAISNGQHETLPLLLQLAPPTFKIKAATLTRALLNGRVKTAQLILIWTPIARIDALLRKDLPNITRSFLESCRNDARLRRARECGRMLLLETSTGMSAEALLSLPDRLAQCAITADDLRLLQSQGRLESLIQDAFGASATTFGEAYEVLAPLAQTASTPGLMEFQPEHGFVLSDSVKKRIPDLPEHAALAAWEIASDPAHGDSSQQDPAELAGMWLSELCDRVVTGVESALAHAHELEAARRRHQERAPQRDSDGWQRVLRHAMNQLSQLHEDINAPDQTKPADSARALQASLEDLAAAVKAGDPAGIKTAKKQLADRYDAYQSAVEEHLDFNEHARRIGLFSAVQQLIAAPDTALHSLVAPEIIRSERHHPRAKTAKNRAIERTGHSL